jgi:hypothetical protein
MRVHIIILPKSYDDNFKETLIMADDKKEKRPQDSSRINIGEDYEISYWTKRFNCSEEELRKAVDAVGVSATKVEEYLKSR